MCTIKKKFANTGLCTISVANANLNGSGTLGTVLTGALSGTVVEQIFIKAQGNVAAGMVRFFIDDGVNTMLIKEVLIPATIQSAVEKSFEIELNDNITLNSGDILKASTDKADTFNIVAFATDWDTCECSTDGSGCCADTKLNSNTGIATIATANPNLDGTGAMSTIVTAPSGGLDGGTTVNYLNIKATNSTTQGMVRLFVDDGGGGIYLFTEIPIPATIQSTIQPAMRTISNLQINLQKGYSINASTQNTQTFNVMADAIDFTNCDCPA